VKRTIPIGALLRVLRKSVRPPVQMKDLTKALNLTHEAHVRNIEAGTRPFPIINVDAVIDVYGQQHNRSYIRYMLHLHRPSIKVQMEDLPKELRELIAMHYAQCLPPELLSAIRPIIYAHTPDMPNDISEMILTARERIR